MIQPVAPVDREHHRQREPPRAYQPPCTTREAGQQKGGLTSVPPQELAAADELRLQEPLLRERLDLLPAGSRSPLRPPLLALPLAKCNCTPGSVDNVGDASASRTKSAGE